MHKFKWYIVLLTFILTFCGVYFFNIWRQQSLVETPVIEAITNVKGVEKVEIEDNGDNLKIYVTLKELERLNEAHSEVLEALSSNYAEGSYDIVLIDERTEHLEKVYDRINIPLMEGARKGNYQQMNEEVSGVLAGEEAINNYRIFIDGENIFFQVSSEEGFLYEVIPLFKLDYGEDNSAV